MTERRSLNAQENNGFGPLLKTRTGFAAKLFSTLLLVTSFALMAYYCLRDSNKEAGKMLVFLFAAAFAYILLFVVELLRRVFLLPEEFSQRESRYEGSVFKPFKATFAFPNPVFLVAAVALIALMISTIEMYGMNRSGQKIHTPALTDMAELCFLLLFMMPALSYLTGLHLSSPVEQSDNNEQQDKNVADGLAWGYYFGYLKLVLPNLERKLGEYTHRDLMSTTKLIILVPLNCFTYSELNTADKRLEPITPQTPELRLTRGGVRARVYKHTAYKIIMANNEVYHCLLEYATPLMNLFDMSEHGEAGLSREDRHTQVKIFMNKLKDILDREEAHVKDTYMLLPFSGEKDTIAETVVNAIKHDKQSVNI